MNLAAFPYLVVAAPRISTNMHVEVNSVRVPVACTTGVHAVDLRYYLPAASFQKPIEARVRIKFSHTGGAVTLAYLRLVAELTPEERGGLIPAAYRVHVPVVQGHPYQRLDALLERQGGFVWPQERGGTEQAWYRDAGTHALIWQLTGSSRTDRWWLRPRQFSPDGRAFTFMSDHDRSYHLYDFAADSSKPLPIQLNDMAFSTSTARVGKWCHCPTPAATPRSESRPGLFRMRVPG